MEYLVLRSILQNVKIAIFALSFTNSNLVLYFVFLFYLFIYLFIYFFIVFNFVFVEEAYSFEYSMLHQSLRLGVEMENLLHNSVALGISTL